MVDALSRKSLHVLALMVRELDLLEQFRDLSLVCKFTCRGSVRLGMLRVTSELMREIHEGQRYDLFLSAQFEAIVVGRPSSFSVGSDGVLRLGGRVCVPSVPELR